MAGRRQSVAGFTLVELVTVIVLLGIVAVASTQFIGQAVGIYSDSTRRDTLQQQARFASERISRELRNALPGSVRVVTDSGIQCVEFIPIIAASSYLQAAADTAISSLAMVAVDYSFVAGDQLVIYPIDENRVYKTPSAMVALTAATAPSAGRQSLNFSSYQFPDESPTRRLFIVSGPVSFCATAGFLYRYDTYSAAEDPSAPPVAAREVLLAEDIRLDDSGVVTVFDFSNGTLQRSALVKMDLRFSSEDEWLRLSQEVFVRNTP